MYRFLSLCTLLFYTTLLVSCGALGKCANNTEVRGDSIVIAQWDSTSAKILVEANRGRIYRLTPVEKPSNGDVTIAGFKVIDEPKVLYKSELSILKFILRNKEMYSNDSTVLKTLFAPYIAIELTHKKGEVFLLIGYNSTQWAIATKTEIIKVKKYNNNGLLLQYGKEVFPDDKYLNYIYNLNK